MSSPPGAAGLERGSEGGAGARAPSPRSDAPQTGDFDLGDALDPEQRGVARLLISLITLTTAGSGADTVSTCLPGALGHDRLRGGVELWILPT